MQESKAAPLWSPDEDDCGARPAQCRLTNNSELVDVRANLSEERF